jgi:hypothetical protein
MGRKLQNECFRIKTETARKCAYSVKVTEHRGCEGIIHKSPRRSARRHSLVLGISERRVRRILHKDLNFHPYNMVAMQEISNRDMANRSRVAERLIGILSL